MTKQNSNSGQEPELSSGSKLVSDLTAGLVVFLVALPLCLGIALASWPSDAPELFPGPANLFAGLIAGIIGGIVVGLLSGSHTSVSGPAAGLVAIVITQLVALQSFSAFLLAVVVAGVFQVILGILKAGSLSAYFPSSVIKGLLAAIGIMIILKQIPHLVGDDNDPTGDMAYQQRDGETTFSELNAMMSNWHKGALIIGMTGVAVLLIWDRIPSLKESLVPGPLVVVALGVAMNYLFGVMDGPLVGQKHLVEIPIAGSVDEFINFLTFPDWSRIADPAIYMAGATIALVASLETLLNLQAVDKLDKQHRVSPPNRELVAQGVGNIVAGMIGGLPITSVIIRGSANVNAGARTRLSGVIHGILLLVSVTFLPGVLNMIPLASLAAILIVTGFKLASLKLFAQMWRDGRYQFIPFIVTLVAIMLTDLLKGVGIGLGVAVVFILVSNLRRSARRIVHTEVDGKLTVLELTNQVTFLNRAALYKVFSELKEGTHLIVDATETDFIDPDVIALIRDFRENAAPARGVSVRLRGFRPQFGLTASDSETEEIATRDMQEKLSPKQVLEILREGNRRFRTNNRLSRDYGEQVTATSDQQNPYALILSCIDSRVPAELVFDLGIGDILSARVVGNIPGQTELASIEYGVSVAGVKLVLVLGHTRCGAVTSAVRMLCDGASSGDATTCDHLHTVLDFIEPSLERDRCQKLDSMNPAEIDELMSDVSRKNVDRTVSAITENCNTVRQAVADGRLLVVGALYDVSSGEIEFFTDEPPLERAG